MRDVIGCEDMCKYMGPYIRGTSETIARILRPYNIWVAHKPIFTLRRLLTDVKEKTNPKTDQEQFIRSTASTARPLIIIIGETGRNLTTWLTEHKRATKKGDLINNITEHHLKTNHAIDWDSTMCLTYSTDYYQRITLESWLTNFEQTALNCCNLFPHLTNVYSTGNSNTLFIIHFTTHLSPDMSSQPVTSFTNGYSIYWPIKLLTRVFEFSTG